MGEPGAAPTLHPKVAGDAALLAAIAEGSEPAWEELYRRHRGSVEAAARMVLGNDPQCADVAIEVFEALWRAPGRFDAARGSLLGYLRCQARSRGIDLLRSETRRRRREERDLRYGSVGERGTEELAMARVEATVLWRTLAELPVPERRAIELAYLGHLSYAEVARRLDQPEGTVKSRIRRGFQRLRVAAALRDLAGDERVPLRTIASLDLGEQ
ncbi:MAG: RNA polymerase sigma factor [Acidimicrobiales bacterium]